VAGPMIKIKFIKTNIKSESSKYIDPCFLQHAVSFHPGMVKVGKFFHLHICRIFFCQVCIFGRFLTKMPEFLKVSFFLSFRMFFSERNISTLAGKAFYLVFLLYLKRKRKKILHLLI